MTDLSEYRLRRFCLQAAARELLPNERVAWCLRRLSVDPSTGRAWQSVHVCYSPKVKRAHYKHLMVCARVWVCPVCAGKISERRRVEISEAIERNKDLRVALVTFTLAHHVNESLLKTLGALLLAYRFLKAGRRWAEFASSFGLVGSIRGLESTYGENGWHVHLHCLFFFDRALELGPVTQALKVRWLECLEKFGRSASDRRGVDVRTARSDVAAYIEKFGHEPLKREDGSSWSVEHELVKANVKQGKLKGRTPMQLLSDYNEGDRRAGSLWLEYAKCFKGKRQLVWSRGLRARLGLDREASDQELAENEDQAAVLLAALSLFQWRVVLANDARADLLEEASSGDVGRLNAFLESIGAGRLGVESVQRVVSWVASPA